jgi:hypothetical protein
MVTGHALEKLVTQVTNLAMSIGRRGVVMVQYFAGKRGKQQQPEQRR